MAVPAIKYTSVEEYLRMELESPEKHEYVEGDMVAMAGATEEHNHIVANILREVGAFLKGKDCAVFPSYYRVSTAAANNYFYPDVSIVCGKTEKQPGVFDTLLNPVAIFEVMSEGSENIDRGYKFFYYQQIPSLKEYILIDSRSYAVEAIRRQANDTWKFEKFSMADKQLPLNSISFTFLLEDIYYRVQFPSSK